MHILQPARGIRACNRPILSNMSVSLIHAEDHVRSHLHPACNRSPPQGMPDSLVTLRGPQEGKQCVEPTVPVYFYARPGARR